MGTRGRAPSSRSFCLSSTKPTAKVLAAPWDLGGLFRKVQAWLAPGHCSEVQNLSLPQLQFKAGVLVARVRELSSHFRS